MGAYYGSEKNWEAFRQFAFEAALTRTDAVIQPRQSNKWGALSLDHVYDFMGGLNPVSYTHLDVYNRQVHGSCKFDFYRTAHFLLSVFQCQLQNAGQRKYLSLIHI